MKVNIIWASLSTMLESTKADERWTISFGVGKEFGWEESFTLTRFSVEYGLENRKGREIFGVPSQGLRRSAHNVTALGIGLSKKLKERASVLLVLF
jgi:hypothetical protein